MDHVNDVKEQIDEQDHHPTHDAAAKRSPAFRRDGIQQHVFHFWMLVHEQLVKNDRQNTQGAVDDRDRGQNPEIHPAQNRSRIMNVNDRQKHEQHENDAHVVGVNDRIHVLLLPVRLEKNIRMKGSETEVEERLIRVKNRFNAEDFPDAENRHEKAHHDDQKNRVHEEAQGFKGVSAGIVPNERQTTE